MFSLLCKTSTHRTDSPPPLRLRITRARIAIVCLTLVLIVVAGLAKGRGYRTRLLRAMNLQTQPLPRPRMAKTHPITGATRVPIDTTIAIDVKVFSTALSAKSVNSQSVVLVRTRDNARVVASVKAKKTGILVTPANPLEPNCDYTLHLTDQITDVAGTAMNPDSFNFTTVGQADPSIRFEKVALEHATGAGFTAVVIGPDNKLYAAADNGRIFRFAINPDGTLEPPRIITSLQTASSGPRLLLGFCFDPASTPEQPIVWAAHSAFGFASVPDWSGGISRLSGTDLQQVEHVIVNLPRSANDHATFQPVIGPDGAIYFAVGSNSASGAPDKTWGLRPERLLSASVLRLDPRKLSPGKTMDVKTRDGGGSYDPSAPHAPLTIYASGVRVAYDLVWASNGKLYAPTNGAAAGGNAPMGNGAPALTNINRSEDDLLNLILPDKYYGHPNPAQGHYVLNGGNLTRTFDPAEISDYPVGTYPDRDYVPPVFNFGQHISANGVIEYTGSAFGGKLDKWLLVCRYNVGSDLIALHVAPDGSIDNSVTGIEGFTDLVNPLDLTEDVRTGSIYLCEYGAQRITLLRPHRVIVAGER